MFIIMVNTHIDQVSHFGGILSWGDFVLTTILPYSMYTITVNNHIDQVLYFLHFFVLGRFYPNNNSTVFYVNILVNTLIDQVSHFGGILSWGGFCPDNNFTVFYVYHYSKQSYRSSLVFFCIFLSWGDFIPTTTLLYSMYNILVNTLIDQVLYFWGDFVLGGFCPNINFIVFICILL